MSCSVDVNLLLYASNETCQEHVQACEALERLARGGDTLCLSWPTIMGYLRMSTHPRIFPSPLSPREAEANIDALLAQPHVRVISELDGFWPLYRDISAQRPARGNHVPDAYLAALLKQHGVRTLYSNDKDFRRFEFLRVLNPLDG